MDWSSAEVALSFDAIHFLWTFGVPDILTPGSRRGEEFVPRRVAHITKDTC